MISNVQEVLGFALEAAAEGEEACGIVCDGVAYRLPNSAPRPDQTFQITPRDLMDFFEDRVELLEKWNGVWHSHPKGQEKPSKDDLGWHPAERVLFIVTTRVVIAYRVYPDGPGSIAAEEIWRSA